MLTFNHKGLLRCSIGRRGRHLCGVASPPVGGIPANVDPFGAPASVAGLSESDHAPAPSGTSADGSGLGPFACPEPFCLYDSAELRLACGNNYTTGVCDATVNSSEESGLHFGGDSESVDPLGDALCHRQRGGPAWSQLDTTDFSPW